MSCDPSRDHHRPPFANQHLARCEDLSVDPPTMLSCCTFQATSPLSPPPPRPCLPPLPPAQDSLSAILMKPMPPPPLCSPPKPRPPFSAPPPTQLPSTSHNPFKTSHIHPTQGGGQGQSYQTMDGITIGYDFIPASSPTVTLPSRRVSVVHCNMCSTTMQYVSSSPPLTRNQTQILYLPGLGQTRYDSKVNNA